MAIWLTQYSRYYEGREIMKYVKKPAEKFSKGYCLICSGNCINDCVGQTICQYAFN